MRPCFSITVLPLLLPLPFCMAENDAAQANGYDAAWSTNWISHCRQVAGATGREQGVVLFIGDSITRHNENSTWPLIGSGQTATDAATINWFHGNQYPSADGDISCPNGLYLSTFGYPTCIALGYPESPFVA